jgi:hypothetical protein
MTEATKIKPPGGTGAFRLEPILGEARKTMTFLGKKGKYLGCCESTCRSCPEKNSRCHDNGLRG